jgi:RNA polymerase sigma factor (TIGR02999 family)
MASNITQLLVNWSDGDQAALNQLMPLVYEELRRLAESYLRRQPYHHTLQPTVLVHEAYLRMVDQQSVNWENRAQFYGMAATLMRRILVDHTREKMAVKRGGGEFRLSLAQADRFSQDEDVDLIALDDALNDLAALNPQHSRIIELRYFGGLTIEEAAAVLGVSHATIERGWTMARAWLRRELSK